MNEYCQILEVSPNATIKEIKNAYRKKAGRIHPDVNPSPTAHEDFIALTEAYESMLRGKTGRVYNETSRNYTRASAAYSETDLKEQARERARRAAQMEYQEFINSDYYKTKMSQYKTLEFWGSLIFFIPFFSVQLHFFLTLKTEFIISSVLLSLITAPLLTNMVSIIKKQSMNQILSDTAYLLLVFLKSDVFTTFIATLINGWIFYTIGIKTLIPNAIMLSIYLIIPISLLIFRGFFKNIMKEDTETQFPQWLYSFGQRLSDIKRPLIVFFGFPQIVFSIFLILNVSYFHSRTQVDKTFEVITNKGSSHLRFDDDKYNHYWGPCYFLDYDQYKDDNTVTLKLKKGLFGIYVLEDYNSAGW